MHLNQSERYVSVLRLLAEIIGFQMIFHFMDEHEFLQKLHTSFSQTKHGQCFCIRGGATWLERCSLCDANCTLCSLALISALNVSALDSILLHDFW